VRIKQNPDKATGELSFEAVIKVWAGTLKKGRIVFSSSQDLEVTSSSILVEGGSKSKERRLPIVAKRKPGGNANSRSWIRLTITYERDKKGLRELAKNTTVYPDPFLRSLLIRQIGQIPETGTESAECFIPAPNAPKSVEESRK
jgi:hypothetical protein